MKAQEIRQKDMDELQSMLKSLKKDLQDLSKNIIDGKEKNVTKIRLLKREYARVATVLNEKAVLSEMEKTNE